jgi:hypothetical protein
LLKLDFQLRTDIDPNNGTFDFTWCGVVSGNTISFPQELNLGSAASMNATINNNTLNINVFFASNHPKYTTLHLIRSRKLLNQENTYQ